jgi:hypothetical protein
MTMMAKVISDVLMAIMIQFGGHVNLAPGSLSLKEM